MPQPNRALMIAALAGVGIFMASRARAGVPPVVDVPAGDPTLGPPGGPGAPAPAGECVPCNWPTPIPPGHDVCPGCLRSWVVPPPFHFLFPWFHPMPVGSVPGMQGWSIPGAGTTVIPPGPGA
jgi:hypothetical protein